VWGYPLGEGAVRLTTINKAIAHTGYELVKGNGYFYFYPLDISTPELYNPSVMTTTLGKDLGFWVREIHYKMWEESPKPRAGNHRSPFGIGA
jgi:hypothetical protein